MRRLSPLLAFASVVLIAACERKTSDGTASDGTAAGSPPQSRVTDVTGARASRIVDRSPIPPLAVTTGMLQPDSTELHRPAPDSFTVAFETSQGLIEVAVRREWAPRGADRLYYLATHGFFDAMRFYKVQRDFIAQFGYTGDPRVTAVWEKLPLDDDPPIQPHAAGTLAFAANGPNSRTTQLFFNLRDNTGLEQQGLAVVGRVIRGTNVLPNLYDVHGQGLGIDRIRLEGNRYLDGFPNLDYIIRASVQR